jgi:DUF1680 family protein
MRKYLPVSFAEVAVHGAFWHERLETVLTRTIPSQHQKLAEHGILESIGLPQPVPPLRIPRNNHNFTTEIFWDSDVGKWIEAASYALRHRRQSAIEAQIDEIAEHLAAAQLPDGYLNCWYIERELPNRWTNLRDNHELYCAGHLLEGALAYFQATGKHSLLETMLRYIDHIATMFGSGPNQKRGYPGHQEIELALIKLYSVTRDQRHLDLAAYFINERGKQPHYFDREALSRGERPEDFWAGTYEYNQSHMPVRDQKKAVGHAVRAMYMYAAMADLAALTNDQALKHACEVLWADVVDKQMYVTGGLGPSRHNEGFTSYFDLPNSTAYAETCASVALIFWAQRMLNIDLDRRYADILELALYNGALAGLSRDGEHYFYDNPLESDGRHQRWLWHSCPCCTMNVSRLVASVGSYFYSTSDDTIAVHLYGGATTTATVANSMVRITETSDYPWAGAISIAVDPETPVRIRLKLRIPAWAKRATANLNGDAIEVAAHLQRGYLEIDRVWRAGDTVNLDLPMPVERIYANPRVTADVGRVALRRGPLIYCAEQIDNDVPVELLRVPRDGCVRAEPRADLFDGVVAVVAEALRAEEKRDSLSLYADAPAALSPAEVTAIPYFLWSNRGSGRMMVWLPES